VSGERYACPDGAACPDPACVAENVRRAMPECIECGNRHARVGHEFCDRACERDFASRMKQIERDERDPNREPSGSEYL